MLLTIIPSPSGRGESEFEGHGMIIVITPTVIIEKFLCPSCPLWLNSGMTSPDEEIEKAKLNLETGQLAWSVLQVYFASGHAISVAPDLDLLEVGFQMSRDNKSQVEAWITAGKVGPVTEEQALDWHQADALLWTLVVRPWVLVQDK